MKWFKGKQTYSQEEIIVQQGIVAEAIKQRNNVIQDHEEHSRACTSVEVAQEILNFMFEENVQFQWEKK